MLQMIQETVERYVQVLHQILKVNIEIVDDAYNVISSTEHTLKRGRYEGYVYRSVVRAGQKKVITEPGDDPICQECPNRHGCEDTFELHVPLLLDEQVIGVICFSCDNEAQRDHMMENYDTFIAFIDQISDLITLKAREAQEQERTRSFLQVLSAVIDRVESCILLIDRQNRLFGANRAAQKLLGLEGADVRDSRLRADLAGGVNENEYHLKIAGRSYSLRGELRQLNSHDESGDRVFIFSGAEEYTARLAEETSTKENLGLKDILGTSPAMRQLKDKVVKVAQSTSTVLITGPSGTGKELFARAIHMQGGRSNAPFVAINCAAIPDTLLESELFGYVRGAFTGADPKGKTGKIELANHGVLFLDEVGDMPLYIQSKLLRALELKEIVRLGSNRAVQADVRFIAATNRDLEAMIRENRFREDLYYRLNVVPVNIPPLRERREDIDILVQFFIGKYAELFDKEVAGVTPQVMEMLKGYDWPGNVRELENTIEYMINMAEGGVLTEQMLPARMLDGGAPARVGTLEQLERQAIEEALRRYRGGYEQKLAAADALGIGVATLYRKIKRYGLDVGTEDGLS